MQSKFLLCGAVALSLFACSHSEVAPTPVQPSPAASLRKTDNDQLEASGRGDEILDHLFKSGSLVKPTAKDTFNYAKLLKKPKHARSAASSSQFNDFIANLAQSKHPWASLAKKIENKNYQQMDEAELEILYQMVGLYARALYSQPSTQAGAKPGFSELEMKLNQLVELNTVHQYVQPGDPELKDPTVHIGDLKDQSKNPTIIQAGQVIKQFANDSRLNFYNPVSSTDQSINRVFIVELPGTGQGEQPLALYMHSDIVPATDAPSWGLPKRGDFQPFTVTLKKDTDIGAPATRAALMQELKGIEAKLKAGHQPNLFDLQQRKSSIIREVNALHGDHLYGRGTIDDKAAIVSSLYSLKTIRQMQDEGLLPRLKRDVHLIIETTEETTTDGVPVYLEWAKVHNIDLSKQISIGLDASYPVCIAEKGIARIDLSYKKTMATRAAGQIEIVKMHGAQDTFLQAQNQINGVAKVYLQGDDPNALKAKIDKEIPAFQKFLNAEWDKSLIRDLKLEGLDAKIVTEIQGSQVIITIPGRERVSFAADDGSNAVVHAYAFVNFLMDQAHFPIIENHYVQMSRFIWGVFKFDYSGTNLGISYVDPYDVNGNPVTNGQAGFMGRLTIVATALTESDTEIKQVFDLRLPRREGPQDPVIMQKTMDAIQAETLQKLNALMGQYGFETPGYRQIYLPRYISPTKPYFKTLVKIFQQTTGKKGWDFVALSGTTTANSALGGVNFGPTMPDEKDVYHQRNEFKSRQGLYQDLQMFSNMFLEISQEQ